MLINILNKTINVSQKEIDTNVKEMKQIKDNITEIKVTNELTVRDMDDKYQEKVKDMTKE